MQKNKICLFTKWCSLINPTLVRFWWALSHSILYKSTFHTLLWKTKLWIHISYIQLYNAMIHSTTCTEKRSFMAWWLFVKACVSCGLKLVMWGWEIYYILLYQNSRKLFFIFYILEKKCEQLIFILVYIGINSNVIES